MWEDSRYFWVVTARTIGSTSEESIFQHRIPLAETDADDPSSGYRLRFRAPMRSVRPKEYLYKPQKCSDSSKKPPESFTLSLFSDEETGG